MKWSRVYAVQQCLHPELRQYGNLLVSHLATYASENQIEGRTLFIELENEPSLARKKETFVALKGWMKQLVGDVKAMWAPRWLLCVPTRTRQILGGIGSDGKVFVTQLAADRASIAFEELKDELAENFR